MALNRTHIIARKTIIGNISNFSLTVQLIRAKKEILHRLYSSAANIPLIEQLHEILPKYLKDIHLELDNETVSIYTRDQVIEEFKGGLMVLEEETIDEITQILIFPRVNIKPLNL